MKNWRLPVFILVGLGLAIISCGGQENRNESKQDEEGNETEIVRESTQYTESRPVQYTKVPIRRNRLTAVRTNPPIQSMVNFLSLYSDDELAEVSELELRSNQIERISGLKRLPNLRYIDLSGNRIGPTLHFEELPVELRYLYLNYNLIEGTFQVTPNMGDLRGLHVEGANISRVVGFENLPNPMGGISFLDNPIENPEEFLKIYGVVGELKFTYAPNISFDQAVEIEAQLREQNPDADLILVLPFIPIEERTVPDT